MSSHDKGVPFSCFAELLSSIRQVKPRKQGASKKKNGTPIEVQLLCAWIERLKTIYNPLPPGTAVSFFRLLFPEEGVRRRYNLKAHSLSKYMEQYLRLKPGSIQRRFMSPPDNCNRIEGVGCLGTMVEELMLLKGRKEPVRQGGITLQSVDKFLDELAALSTYSASEVRDATSLDRNARTRIEILKDLLDPLDASEAAFLVQIILRDLSPILYPAPSRSSSVTLSQYTSNPYHIITLHKAMSIWHPRMSQIYQTSVNFEHVLQALDSSNGNRSEYSLLKEPVWGIYSQPPKTARPGTCSKATKDLEGLVAVETKYDGERLQVHIDLNRTRSDQIRIFSKSGRDSTVDRKLLLPVIRASLGLPLLLEESLANPRLAMRSGQLPRRSEKSQYILEGEMISWNEKMGRVDEYWKLDLVKRGIPVSEEAACDESQATTVTTCSTSYLPPQIDIEPELHLCIAWFDILMSKSEAFVNRPYEERRAEVEATVHHIDGFSILVEQKLIDFSHRTALQELRRHFARVISLRGEGLILKPVQSKYNDYRKSQRWIKLKKDFIPGAGDTHDFEVVGVSWQAERGRTLCVPKTTFTTFFIGLLVEERSRPGKPHYHIEFTSSYGLSRDQLDKTGNSLRCSDPAMFDFADPAKTGFIKQYDYDKSTMMYGSPCLDYTFSLSGHLCGRSNSPTFILHKPRIFELTGAGFQKHRDSPYYSLRWPRITKVDKDQGESLSLSRLQIIAKRAMQISDAVQREAIDQVWSALQQPISSSATTTGCEDLDRYQLEVDEWVRKLEAADGLFSTPSVPSSPFRNVACRNPPLRSIQVVSGPSAVSEIAENSSDKLSDEVEVIEWKRRRVTHPGGAGPTRNVRFCSHQRFAVDVSIGTKHAKGKRRRTQSSTTDSSASPSLHTPMGKWKMDESRDLTAPTLSLITHEPGLLKLSPMAMTYTWSTLATSCGTTTTLYSTISDVFSNPTLLFPRHPHLSQQNYIHVPFNVVWAAGWRKKPTLSTSSSPSGGNWTGGSAIESSPFLGGAFRQGVIFTKTVSCFESFKRTVESEWIKEEGSKIIYCILEEGMDKMGLWDSDHICGIL